MPETDVKKHAPSDAFVKDAHVDAEKYNEMYQASIDDPPIRSGANTASGSTGSRRSAR